MIEPTERALWGLVSIAVVGVGGFAWAPIGEAAPVLAAAWVLAVVVDAIAAGAPGRVRAHRALSSSFIEGRTSSYELVLACDRTVDVELVDALPAAAVADPEPSVTTTLQPGAVAHVAIERVFRRRGVHRCGALTLRTRGPLGLVRRRQRRELPDEIRVVVDLSRSIALAERALRGQEPDGARRRGMSDGREFDGLRAYVRGDDVRHVDWKASARHDALVVRKHRPEARQDIVVVLDAGRHLLGAHEEVDGGATRFEVALQAAIVVAAAALSRGDRAGLCSIGSDLLSWHAPADGIASLRLLAGSVERVDASAVEPAWQRCAEMLLVRQKRRALVLFVTDVVDEDSARGLAAAVARLRARHLVGVIAVGDPGLLRLSTSKPPIDDPLATTVPLAAARLLEHRLRAVAALQAAGAVVVDAPAPRAAQAAVALYADIKATGRL